MVPTNSPNAASVLRIDTWKPKSDILQPRRTRSIAAAIPDATSSANVHATASFVYSN